MPALRRVLPVVFSQTTPLHRLPNPQAMVMNWIHRGFTMKGHNILRLEEGVRLRYVKLCCGLWQSKTKLHGGWESAEAMAAVGPML